MTDIAQQLEIESTTAELYKKNLELSYKNTLLMILEKITLFATGTYTNTKELSDNIASLLIKEAGASLVSIISLKEKENHLFILTTATGPLIEAPESLTENTQIQLTDTESPIINCVQTRSVIVLEKQEEANNTLGLQTQPKKIFVYPLLNKGKLTGVLYVEIEQMGSILQTYKYELIQQSVPVISTVLAASGSPS